MLQGQQYNIIHHKAQIHRKWEKERMKNSN